MVDVNGRATDYGYCGSSCPINKIDRIGYSQPRDDGRCGLQFGGAICSADTSYGPCCSLLGYCGSTDYHCKCEDCKDFRRNEDVSATATTTTSSLTTTTKATTATTTTS